MTYLIGADPELFVVNNDDGVFVNGHGLIPGTKEEPFKVQNGAFQVDGMALEFNIDPAATRAEFIHNVVSVRDQLNAAIAAKNLRVINASVARFSPDYMKAQPEESLRLGCEPDYNAWTQRVNEPPEATRPMRTAAGHVHIGWGDGFDPMSFEHYAKCCAVVRHLDNLVGLGTVLLDRETTRREMYGRAGAFRPKPYGVEWRVPSNFWVGTERSIGWMYDSVIRAMELFDAEDYRFNDAAVDIINNSDEAAARENLDPEFLQLLEKAA